MSRLTASSDHLLLGTSPLLIWQAPLSFFLVCFYLSNVSDKSTFPLMTSLTCLVPKDPWSVTFVVAASSPDWCLHTSPRPELSLLSTFAGQMNLSHFCSFKEHMLPNKSPQTSLLVWMPPWTPALHKWLLDISKKPWSSPALPQTRYPHNVHKIWKLAFVPTFLSWLFTK